MLADEAEALLVFGTQAVLEKKEVIRLEVAGEARGLDRVEFFVAVVQQLDLLAELRSQMLEEAGHRAEIRGGLEDFRLRQRRHVGDAARRCLGRLRARCPVRSLESGNRHLGANAFEAALDRVTSAVFHLREIASARVRVSQSADPGASAEQLVDGHAGALALDVPEREVHSRERGHLHRTSAPVRAAVEILPGVLDALRVAADEQRRDVLLEVLRDGQLPPVERRVADAV